jgi:PIN domain nuclease of toxin-antitoxin system
MIPVERKCLLDTNVLIWLSSDLRRVPRTVLEILEDSDSSLFASTISFWELSIKQGLGKLDSVVLFDIMTGEYGIRELGITSKYTDTVRELPRLHGDPFDRMLVAQAMVEGMVLVTSDGRLAEYPVAVLRV